MHQKDKRGGGISEEEDYTTWELKECPVCDRLVVEYYTARVVGQDKRELKIFDVVTL